MVSPLQNKLYLYIKRDFDFELLESSNGFKFSFFCHHLGTIREMLDSLSYVTMCLDLHDNLGLLGEPCRVVATGGCLGWTTLSQPPSVTDRSKSNLADVLMASKVKKLIVT